MDQTIYYGTIEGNAVAVSHANRFIHTSITVESQNQRDEALIKQVSQDIERLESNQPSVTILISESYSQLDLIRTFASKKNVPLYTVNAANVSDLNEDASLIEIYKSGGIILVNFNVPEFAKEVYYEQYLTQSRNLIFNRSFEEMIPTFIIVDQSIQYLFNEKKDDNKHNGLEIILAIGRSRSIGVTLLFDSESVIPPMMRANTHNVFRFNKNHEWTN